ALHDETLLRLSSTARFHRGGHVYYYLETLAWAFGTWGVLLGALAPALVRRWRAGGPDAALVAFAVRAAGVLVVFFTCSASSRPRGSRRPASASWAGAPRRPSGGGPSVPSSPAPSSRPAWASSSSGRSARGPKRGHLGNSPPTSSPAPRSSASRPSASPCPSTSAGPSCS